MEEKRDYHLDLMRLIATFSVVMLHVAASQWYTSPIEGFQWMICNIYDSLVRFCVPLFFMISGALFLNHDKPFSIGKLFKKNILRLFVALIVWTVLYAIWDLAPVFIRDSSRVTGELICNKLIDGHYHLWFIPSLISLYVLVPILRCIVTNRVLLKYSIVLAFISSIVIYSLQLSWFNETPVIYLVRFLDKFYLNYFGEYIIYFLLGYYLNNSKLKKHTINILIVASVISSLAIILGTKFYSLYSGTKSGDFYTYKNIFVFFQALGVFIFVKEYLSKIYMSKRFSIFCKIVSPCLFGIYILHPMILEFFKLIKITTNMFNMLFSIPIITTIIFLIAFLISFVLSKIPVVKHIV